MSVAWWLWVGVLAAKKPKAPAAPEGPPPPVASVLRGDALAAAAPAFTGSAETLDIQSMRRTEISYAVELPEAELLPGAAAVPGLVQTLAAHPRWRVAGEPGAVVATLRAGDAEPAAPLGSFRCDARGCRSAVIAVGALAGPWRDAAAKGDTSTTRLVLSPVTLTESSARGLAATSLVVQGGAVSYGVYEAGDPSARPFTEGALEAIGEALWATSNAGDLAATRGGAGAMLPRGEPGRPSGPVVVSAAGGVDVRARVNPGAAGWAWWRLMRDGAPVEESTWAAATREVVGWSADPSHGFYMQAVVPAAGAVGELELWFEPDAAGWTPVRLGAWPVNVAPPRP